MTNFPEFSWSHHRDRTLQECERRYYWTYYGGHNGWSAGSSPDTQLAWRLKHLQTLMGALGHSIHQRARELATAYQLGAPPPSIEFALQRTREDLNRLWRYSTDEQGFFRDPKTHPMLLAAYYGREIEPTYLRRVQERLARCVNHLYSCPLWNELEALPATEILVVEELAHFFMDGVKIYVSPDLVYRAADSLWTVVDWKTGGDTSAREQLALYALYARDHLQLPLAEGKCRCRVIKLGEGSETAYWIASDEIEAAAARVRSSVERMKGYVADSTLNAPLAREHFRLTRDRAMCWNCKFREFCENEIQSQSAKREEISWPSDACAG